MYMVTFGNIVLKIIENLFTHDKKPSLSVMDWSVKGNFDWVTLICHYKWKFHGLWMLRQSDYRK